jgi:hypothetical protein
MKKENRKMKKAWQKLEKENWKMKKAWQKLENEKSMAKTGK